MSWRVSAQITILNIPFHMKSVQAYCKVRNMEMNLWELAIHLNILNISKDFQRICSNFIWARIKLATSLKSCLSQLLRHTELWLTVAQCKLFNMIPHNFERHCNKLAD